MAAVTFTGDNVAEVVLVALEAIEHHPGNIVSVTEHGPDLIIDVRSPMAGPAWIRRTWTLFRGYTLTVGPGGFDWPSVTICRS